MGRVAVVVGGRGGSEVGYWFGGLWVFIVNIEL